MPAPTELTAVLQVAHFLEQHRDGGTWARTPERSSDRPHSLYHGSAGVGLFQLELHRATGEPRFLDVARAAGDELLTYMDGRDFLTIGIYSGWPGMAFFLNELAIVTDDDRYRTAATAAIDRIVQQSQPLGAGVGWIEPMPFSDITGMTGDREVLDLSVGAAGAGVVLLHAHRAGLHDRALEIATAAAERLMEMRHDTEAGPTWLMMADMPFPFTAPNFAHGASGVAYFLADLFRETGDQRLLDIAIEAAGYVESRSISVPATDGSGEDGLLVIHTEEMRPPDLCYLGTCHGPGGTGRLMHILYELTGEEKWHEWMHHNMRGLLNTGAPEVRSAGLWNNYGQCCGDAGIGDYALALHGATGRPEYLELAERVRDSILAASTLSNGARSWTQAEHRTRPDFCETQTGYMQGAAGIASFLLALTTHQTAQSSKIVHPDSPFNV